MSNSRVLTDSLSSKFLLDDQISRFSKLCLLLKIISILHMQYFYETHFPFSLKSNTVLYGLLCSEQSFQSPWVSVADAAG